MGGSVGLHGTDGDSYRRAEALGATRIAGKRAGRALYQLASSLRDAALITPSGSMGADSARRAGFDPETFDIARGSNRHVGFGYSIHYCLGAAIARLEGALGLGAFLERFPNASLATDAFEWDPLVLSRSLRRLPIRIDR